MEAETFLHLLSADVKIVTKETLTPLLFFSGLGNWIIRKLGKIMDNIKQNRSYWGTIKTNEQFLEATAEVNLKDLSTVIWGKTAVKILTAIRKGADFIKSDAEVRFLVTYSLSKYFKAYSEQPNKGFNVWICECGSSFKSNFIVEKGYSDRFKDKEKSIEQCKYILTDNVFDCKGTQFRKTNKENVFVRDYPYRRYQVAVISETKPKISQWDIKEIINNFYQFGVI